MNSSYLIRTDSLFIKAWEYHNKFISLQNDINLQLAAVRNSVSNVLRISSNTTLKQIEENSVAILEKDAFVRDTLFSLEITACTNNLKSLLNGVTEFSGFPSSNCINRYDEGVKIELNDSLIIMEKYNGLFNEVQQIVIKSFIRQNAFLTPDAIIATFENQYEFLIEKWEKIVPSIEIFVKSLAGNIAVHKTALDGCFNIVQVNLTPSYNRIVDEIIACHEFDNTKSPFSKFMKSFKPKFLKLEDILPKFE